MDAKSFNHGATVFMPKQIPATYSIKSKEDGKAMLGNKRNEKYRFRY